MADAREKKVKHFGSEIAFYVRFVVSSFASSIVQLTVCVYVCAGGKSEKTFLWQSDCLSNPRLQSISLTGSKCHRIEVENQNTHVKSAKLKLCSRILFKQ